MLRHCENSCHCEGLSLRGRRPKQPSSLRTSRHCEGLSLRGAVIARPQAEATSPQPRAAGSASPPCLHNVGYGRPAPRGCGLLRFARNDDIALSLCSSRLKVARNDAVFSPHLAFQRAALGLPPLAPFSRAAMALASDFTPPARAACALRQAWLPNKPSNSP